MKGMREGNFGWDWLKGNLRNCQISQINGIFWRRKKAIFGGGLRGLTEGELTEFPNFLN
jgi:hypothetical protein